MKTWDLRRATQYPQPPGVYRTMVAALQAHLMNDAREAALSRLVAEVSLKLRAIVRRRVRNLSDAEDIVQEALLELATAYWLAEPIERAAASVARVEAIAPVRATRSLCSSRIRRQKLQRTLGRERRPLNTPAHADERHHHSREDLARNLALALMTLLAAA